MSPLDKTPIPKLAAATPWPARYDMLDGWRGLAALAVVCCHAFGWEFGAKGVMLFFVISGYCVTAAGEAARRKSLGFRGFMWRRVKRIYPPYLLAVLFFLATRFVKARQGGDDQFHHPWPQWIQNFTLTQWFAMVGHPVAHPYDNPVNFVAAFWSLQYEEQFYLILAIMLPLTLVMRSRMIILLMLVSLVWKFFFPQAYFGFFIELWFHFGIGSVVYYRLCVLKSARWRLGVDLVMTAMTITGCIFWALTAGTSSAYALVIEDLAIVCLFATLLVAIRPLDPIAKSPLLRPIMGLGTISYSLYLVHQFNLRSAKIVADRLMPHFSAGNALVQMAVFLGIATVFWFFCERPFLNKPLVVASTNPERPLSTVGNPGT